MDDLNSTAYFGSDPRNKHGSSSPCSNIHNHLQHLNADIVPSMDTKDSPFYDHSPLDSDLSSSSGYLQDVLLKFSHKRRRLLQPDDHNSSSPFMDYWHSNFDDSDKNFLNSNSFEGGKDEQKKNVRRIVCPFAFVKSGGFKGDMTLNDINQRLLKPPTRPVKHPVGDFAYRSLVSLYKPGLSGKVVVALTRIQTHGRGTITVIRTEG